MDAVVKATEALASGEPVVLVEGPGSDAEGVLLLAAEAATARLVAFAVRYTSGLLLAPMSARRADWLGLTPLLPGCSATVPVDGWATGSGEAASGRAATFRALADPSTRPSDLRRPGHVFPLRAARGGVLEQPGRPEAAVDLLELAGCEPVGLAGSLVARDGSLMVGTDLRAFAAARGLVAVTVAEVVLHRSALPAGLAAV